MNCQNLVSINLPDSLCFIDSSAFAGCASLKTIEIPENVTDIGHNAFEDCSELVSITVPNGVSSLSRTFDGCSSLKNVSLPNTLVVIGDRTFSNCTSLESVTIPDSVTQIGVGAFNGCSSLSSIYLPDNITDINEETFRGCKALGSISMPNSVVSIGNGAFEGCVSLELITISNSVNYIGERAFMGCEHLTSISLPDNLTTIQDATFRYSGLEYISIPKNVRTIGAEAFMGCSNLSNVLFESTTNNIEKFGNHCFDTQTITTISSNGWDPIPYIESSGLSDTTFIQRPGQDDPAPKIAIEVPTISDREYGYSTFDIEVKIINTGDLEANITTEGLYTNGEWAEIDGSHDVRVPAGGSVTWNIIIHPGLSPGQYEIGLEIGYSYNDMIIHQNATLSFRITGIPNPDVPDFDQETGLSSEGEVVFKIDYITETIQAGEGYELAYSDTSGVGENILEDNLPGRTVFIRISASNNVEHSKWVPIHIDSRPVAPALVWSTDSNGTGTIAGVSPNMEWRTVQGTWQSCTGTTIDGLVSGIYEVRLIAVDGSSFSGEITQIRIGGEDASPQTNNLMWIAVGVMAIVILGVVAITLKRR